MRICIVAFDGLEASLVKRWQLRNLLQLQNGVFHVGEEFSSPTLWSSFLTGLKPEQHGVKVFVSRGFGDKLRKLTFLPLARKIGKKVFKPRPPTVRKKYRTFFDFAENPLPYNVFCYNELEEQFKLRLKYSLPETVGDKGRSERAFEEWMSFTRERAKDFVYLLKNKVWDLAMTHYFYTDVVGHLFGKKLWIMYRVYKLADTIVESVKNYVDDALLLVVSDHGMRNGMHTSYGFYSMNNELNWNPTAITDFFPWIKKMLKTSASQSC